MVDWNERKGRRSERGQKMRGQRGVVGDREEEGWGGKRGIEVGVVEGREGRGWGQVNTGEG